MEIYETTGFNPVQLLTNFFKESGYEWSGKSPDAFYKQMSILPENVYNLFGAEVSYEEIDDVTTVSKGTRLGFPISLDDRISFQLSPERCIRINVNDDNQLIKDQEYFVWYDEDWQRPLAVHVRLNNFDRSNQADRFMCLTIPLSDELVDFAPSFFYTSCVDLDNIGYKGHGSSLGDGDVSGFVNMSLTKLYIAMSRVVNKKGVL